MTRAHKTVIGAAMAVALAGGTFIYVVHQVLTRPAASSPNVADLIAGTAWEWGHGGECVLFGKDGFIEHPGWKQRGLVTRWATIDEHTVLLTIVEGSSDRTRRAASRSAGCRADPIGSNRRTEIWPACGAIPWRFFGRETTTWLFPSTKAPGSSRPQSSRLPRLPPPSSRSLEA
jgi:hypothetical protein